MNRAVFASVAFSILVSACGGGGGGGGRQAPPPPPPTQSDFEQGIFSDSAVYKDLCNVPRGAGFPDVQGTTTNENDWLRAWSNDLYLWYDEIVDVDPRSSNDPLAYFELMKTPELSPSGQPKDKFHFTFDTEEWEQLSQSGESAGYGAEFVLLRATPPREVVVAFVEPLFPADLAGVTRGVRILEVDGEDLVSGSDPAVVDVLNAGLFPSTAGEMHEFLIEELDGSTRPINLQSTIVTQEPVLVTDMIATPAGLVGYMLFNTHIATAEAALVTAMRTFRDNGIADLVLDLRYNGGGFLDIANELAFMVAGPAATDMQSFGRLEFNDQHPDFDPVTGAPLDDQPFHTRTQGFPGPQGPLPSVDLPRLFVLTGPGTCSASEAIINALLGIGIEVILIGDPTCGKPYGFYPTDNCGTTYFTIQFRGVNNVGFGDYSDGFIPTPTPTPGLDYEVTGCEVDDDFGNPLGDPTEARLAVALNYIENGDCGPIPVVAASAADKTVSIDGSGPGLVKPRRMPGTVSRR